MLKLCMSCIHFVSIITTYGVLQTIVSIYKCAFVLSI